MVFDAVCFFSGFMSYQDINPYFRFDFPCTIYLILLISSVLFGMMESDIFIQKLYPLKIRLCIALINAIIVLFWACLTIILLI